MCSWYFWGHGMGLSCRIKPSRRPKSMRDNFSDMMKDCETAGIWNLEQHQHVSYTISKLWIEGTTVVICYIMMIYSRSEVYSFQQKELLENKRHNKHWGFVRPSGANVCSGLRITILLYISSRTNHNYKMLGTLRLLLVVCVNLVVNVPCDTYKLKPNELMYSGPPAPSL